MVYLPTKCCAWSRVYHFCFFLVLDYSVKLQDRIVIWLFCFPRLFQQQHQFSLFKCCTFKCLTSHTTWKYIFIITSWIYFGIGYTKSLKVKNKRKLSTSQKNSIGNPSITSSHSIGCNASHSIEKSTTTSSDVAWSSGYHPIGVVAHTDLVFFIMI